MLSFSDYCTQTCGYEIIKTKSCTHPDAYAFIACALCRLYLQYDGINYHNV